MAQEQGMEVQMMLVVEMTLVVEVEMEVEVFARNALSNVLWSLAFPQASAVVEVLLEAFLLLIALDPSGPESHPHRQIHHIVGD